MKTIIELMQAEMSDNILCQSDLEYDASELEKYEGWFLWMCRESETSLLLLSKERYEQYLEKEPYRFNIYRDQEASLCSMDFFKDHDGAKYYLGFSSPDNPKLLRIEYDMVKTLYHVTYDELFRKTIRRHQDEYAVAKKPLPIKFVCSLSYVKECLRKSEEVNGNLLEKLKSKRHYVRNHKDEWIEIGKDWSKHSFTFAVIHIENGGRVCTLNGGIIFYDDKWHSHT